MANNYNGIARFYDVISRIVYQNAIVKAQVFLIQFIKANDKVLIVGGGTGWILEEISKLNQLNISIVYVEKSSAMIALAKSKKYKNIKVDFIEKGIEEYISALQFDIIITPFLFDNFLKNKIDFVFQKLNTLINLKGIWLYADFVNDRTNKKLWQRFLLKTMYLFFRVTANIETQELINMQPYFEKDYALLSQQYFYKGFIQAIAFKKIV
ncbi:MAG: class I SAM-dependent methyltransferase [Parafilimonas sp.]